MTALASSPSNAPRAPFFRRGRVLALALCLVLCIALALSAALFALHPGGTQTYLILGIDNYGSLAENGRSDVMMLVQIDFDHSDISTVTFARDMFIPDLNNRDQKINAIVRQNDENTLMQSLENAFGLTIDGWFRVNFTTLILLVDAMGGASVELTEKEARYIDRTIGAYPDSPLSEGVCQLNGAQALCFARCRNLDSDIGRGQRQNRLMAAMVAQTRRMTLSNILDVFRSLQHAWTSSLTGAEQAKLLSSALWLRGAQTTQIGVPFEGEYYYGDVRGNNGIIADLEDNRRLLHEALGLGEADAVPEGV